MAMLLAGGMGILLIGLLALGLGIQDKEFEVGKTLILAGTIVSCTGLLVLSLLVAVREVKTALGGPAARMPLRRDGDVDLPELAPHEEAAGPGGSPFGRDQQPAPAPSPRPVVAEAPWQQESEARSRGAERPAAAAPVAEPVDPAEPKPRRNLLFSSTSRRERDHRAAGRPGESPDAPPPFAEQAPVPPVAPRAPAPEPPPATFDDAWPQPERTTPRRPARTPSTFSDNAAAAAQVTVLKSGVVDGMAYSLYSDGSIEAQMEEGMMRFGSIDELRTHLDQRS